jgi:predicted 3-demethylubiquinone-9 3-methyltransferase (glyoxalase superfamily)
MPTPQKITPFLWFDTQAEEAANFYVSLFPDSRIERVDRYGEEGPGPAGSVMLVTFRLAGQEFMALNGGPICQFNESVSFYVHCDTQDEIDRLWDRLADGGQPIQCGWIKDKYGLAWQIVPANFGQLISSGDPARSARVMRAMFQMVKFDIATLQRAYDQE